MSASSPRCGREWVGPHDRAVPAMGSVVPGVPDVRYAVGVRVEAHRRVPWDGIEDDRAVPAPPRGGRPGRRRG
ncbi:hypothetical protein ACWEP2_01230, partial [Streptomyces sp. NPDC004279]